jgi:hypothetical protein
MACNIKIHSCPDWFVIPVSWFLLYLRREFEVDDFCFVQSGKSCNFFLAHNFQLSMLCKFLDANDGMGCWCTFVSCGSGTFWHCDFR